MKLSRSRLAPSLATGGNDSWSTYFEALARHERGEDIVLLSIGDPDFPTPPYIIDALIDSIHQGRTHYSPPQGEPRLRQVISDLETKSTGRHVDVSRIAVFPGATPSVFSVLKCIANPGDGVVTPEPSYVGYAHTFKAAGVEMIRVPMTPPQFRVDPHALLDAVTSKTVAILVNTPTNPTGWVMPQQDLEDLATECRRRGLWLISDEVYSQITYERPHTSLLQATTNHENVIVIDGLSKSHAMTGWRSGWTISPPDLASDLERLNCAIFFGCSQFIQDASAVALAKRDIQTTQMRIEYQRRRDHLLRRISETPGFSAQRPLAGIFVMVRGPLGGDEMARLLLDEALVSVFSGSAFGPSASQYFRVSLTQTLPEIDRAWDRIHTWASASRSADLLDTGDVDNVRSLS